MYVLIAKMKSVFVYVLIAKMKSVCVCINC